MFSHQVFLVLGGDGGDIRTLINTGYDVVNITFGFEQGIDHKEKATTRVFCQAFTLTLPRFPDEQLISWGMSHRQYKDGVIVLLNDENIPIQKIYFKNAACIGFKLDFEQQGVSYASTKLVIQPERVIIGSGITFSNEWTD